ncbi:hypothetical protein [Pelagibacterium sp.]|uniref:hypothetical protein n=1 Tax=Pelagibacterium sp. TaxID=1967288 RepID=UPI003A9084C0
MTDKSIAQVEAELLERVRTEGVLVAYETCLAICRDQTAPANAKAAASGWIFRVGGYLSKESTTSRSKEPHEMSPDEMAQEIERLDARARQLGTANDPFS